MGLICSKNSLCENNAHANMFPLVHGKHTNETNLQMDQHCPMTQPLKIPRLENSSR